jgi:hypothetical protein
MQQADTGDGTPALDSLLNGGRVETCSFDSGKKIPLCFYVAKLQWPVLSTS